MKALRKKTKNKKGDSGGAALKTFNEEDLGDTLKKYRSMGQWVKPKTKPTSIALSEETIHVLREKASRKGIGYQTLLKMIVQEHLHEY